MKQYVIDQLRLSDYQKLKTYLSRHFNGSGIEGIYWVPLDSGIFNSTQRQHTHCQPFYFALELEEQRLACELLVRTQRRVRCGCMGYADATQRTWLMDLVDDILNELDIKI